MDKQELKPCHCKNINVQLEDISRDDTNSTALYRIYCPECGMYTDYEENRQIVIDTWNNRPTEDTLTTENKRLRKSLDDKRRKLNNANRRGNRLMKKNTIFKKALTDIMYGEGGGEFSVHNATREHNNVRYLTNMAEQALKKKP